MQLSPPTIALAETKTSERSWRSQRDTRHTLPHQTIDHHTIVPFAIMARTSRRQSDEEREQYATAIAKTQPQWDCMTARAGTGTPYNISEDELCILQDPTFSPLDRSWRPFPPPMSLSQAHTLLRQTASRRASWASVAARQRLSDAYYAAYGTRSPGLLIKVINDIDTVVFGGVLRNRILIHWIDFSVFTRPLHSAPDAAAAKKQDDGELKSNLNPPPFLATTVLPPAKFRDSVRPAIYLNAEVMCVAARSQVQPFALLLHEMLHAYLAILSRPSAPNAPEELEDFGSAANEHDAAFEETCEVLASRLGFKGLRGRDLACYYRHPLPVVMPRMEERRRVRMEDGLRHLVVPPTK